MVLRTLRTSFILAGLVVLVSAAGDARGLLRANLTSQGSTLPDLATTQISTMELRQHLSAPERARRDASGEVGLGSIFFLIGFALHAAIRRRGQGNECAVEESRVRVHTAPARKGRETRRVDRWFLWMTVRM